MAAIRVALVLVLVALAGCGGDDDPRPRTVEAVFDEPIPKVYEGDDVRVAGVNIGEVAKVRREGDTTVLVMRRTHPACWCVAPRTTAILRPRIFEEGHHFVDLGGPIPRRGGPELEDGDRIPAARTEYKRITGDDVLRRLEP